MTAEGENDESAQGVLPTLRAAEDTLGRAQARQTRVARLLDLQSRYRQDTSTLKDRVEALFKEALEDEESQTDSKREEMHARSKAVFDGVKALKERVRQAQLAYRKLGISTTVASTGGGGGGGRGGRGGRGGAMGGSVHEERLSELKRQIRGVGERLALVRCCAEEDEEEARRLGGGGGEEEEEVDEDGEPYRPPTSGAYGTE